MPNTQSPATNRARRGRQLFCALLIFCALLAGVHILERTLWAPDYIAVLEINGTISSNDGVSYDQQYLLDSLSEIRDDPHNAALLLRIDSPGGAVYQIDELYRALTAYKADTGRPVYAAVESYAASGGYYTACAADAVYANPNAIIGSIGVYMGEFVDLSGLMDRLGIDVRYIASGENKTMGSAFVPLTEEQAAIYQSIVDEYYDRFVRIVAEGRHLEETAVRKLADGRIYSASQALASGLIDGTESYEDTLQRLQDDLGRGELALQYYSYQAPGSLMDYLYQAGLLPAREQSRGSMDPTFGTPQLLMLFRG